MELKIFIIHFWLQSSTAGTIDTLANCKDMTGDNTSCDAATKRGWYINLDKASKVTAEPTLAGMLPIIPFLNQ